MVQRFPLSSLFPPPRPQQFWAWFVGRARGLGRLGSRRRSGDRRRVGLVIVAFGLGCHLTGCTAWPWAAANPSATQTIEPSPEATPAAIDPDGSNWYAYISPDRGYSVKFPSQPIERAYDRAVALLDRGDRVYWSSGEGIHPRQTPVTNEVDRQSYLDSLGPGLVRQFGGQEVEYSERLTVAGWPARRLAFRNSQGFQFEVRAIFDPDQARLFVLAFGTTGDNLAIPEAEAFFKSFRPLD